MRDHKFTPESYEALFDAFIDQETSGTRVDKSVKNEIIANSKAADYVFHEEKIIIELKTLDRNHGSRGHVLSLVDEAIRKRELPPTVKQDWVNRRAPLPKSVTRFVDKKVQNSMKGAVRKANLQLEATKNFLGKGYSGVLIVANLQEMLFGPMEMLKILSFHALDRSSCHIDALLLMTPGVSYVSPSSFPQHYIAPAYAEGKTYLGDFIEPLVKKWIEFEASAFGQKSEVEMKFEIDESSKQARPHDGQ